MSTVSVDQFLSYTVVKDNDIDTCKFSDTFFRIGHEPLIH